ncbi:DUF58 domain-containing protein [Rhodopirellula sp. MGV]|uniref:DUF58 domain-containing protein n=1 Tax=Rhodopirellula sp. MGV TaxID=2023130 RepID=UPI000B962D0A|nr:DUF58 domain-containing protein [Rhodopirellula sp. MGV]OYP38820.1 hypothetical protein CGZ80_00935 [Rhodopirellula sp. MGV]PNY37631.1 DUF58 domain-containing protein [Rhodopirellula baltica]
MAMVHDAPKGNHWLVRLLTTDYCPGANRFLYWLKEPAGWFCCATLASALIGHSVSPIGWTLAACLLTLLVVGMAWPWVAVRSVQCELSPDQDRVHEDSCCQFTLTVTNRLPIPVWGLAIDGFLEQQKQPLDGQSMPTVALAFVRGCSRSTYRFEAHPQVRGLYPTEVTLITCAFPFGIWTAKKPLTKAVGITVWPKVYPIGGRIAACGSVLSQEGNGQRRGMRGDFTGVRDYQTGDSIKHINWVATARNERLIVTERGAPQCPQVVVSVDTSCGASPEALSDRIRVAASLLVNLHQSQVPLQVEIGSKAFVPRRGYQGRVQILDQLAKVPLLGDRSRSQQALFASARPRPEHLISFSANAATVITISSNAEGNPVLCTMDLNSAHRRTASHRHHTIDRQDDLARQLSTFWTERADAIQVA